MLKRNDPIHVLLQTLTPTKDLTAAGKLISHFLVSKSSSLPGVAIIMLAPLALKWSTSAATLFPPTRSIWVI
jgi:hypothetical protein